MRRHGKGNTTQVLAIRLAQEKPEFYKAYTRGEYTSITAAAYAALRGRRAGRIRITYTFTFASNLFPGSKPQ
jgi:hypothetical protein